MEVAMVFTIEIKKKEWEKIISFLGNLINLEEEAINLNSIFFTQFFHIRNMDLKIVQIGDIFEMMLFKYFIVSFSKKPLELEYEIIEYIFIFMRSLQKCIHDMDELISADNRVDKSSDLIGDHTGF